MNTYTITISGREREDGEKPYTWVAEGADLQKASDFALAFHAWEQEEDPDNLIIEEAFEGLPDANCGYWWNDLRGESIPSLA